MSRFRQATRVQMIVMTVVWLAVLLVIDYTKNPHLRAADPVATAATRTNGLALWINHLCCTGCMGDVRSALAGLPWVDPEQIRAREHVISREQADEHPTPQSDYGGWVDVGVTSVAAIDFVEIDRALREKGMVASRMEFSGPQHFRLEAKVHHLCCGMCRDATDRIPTLDRARMRLRWVDSVTSDRASQKVTVHARYQEAGAPIDVADLLGALDEVGLPAMSLHILADAEPRPMTPGGSAGR
jgi:hypothetical protein